MDLNTVPSVFIAEHDVMWHGISLWFISHQPGCVTFQPLAHPQTICLRSRVRNRAGPDAVHGLPTNSENISVLVFLLSQI